MVTVDGQRVDLGVGTQVRTDAFSGFDPAGLAASRQLYGLTGQGLVTVSETRTVTVPGPILKPSRKASSAAVEPNASRGAVVSADGSKVTTAGMTTTDTGTSVWYSGGTDVIKPSWDIDKMLWIVDNRANGAHLYTNAGAGSQEVYAPGITGRRVHSVTVSRDGVRLAAIVGRGDHRRLVLAVIDRDPADPTAVSVRPAHRVSTAGPRVIPVSSASWVSPTSIAALVDTEAGELEPAELNIDGAPTLVSRFPGFLPIKPIALAAGPNDDTPTAIADRRGALYEQTVTTEWAQIGGVAAVRAPFFPG